VRDALWSLERELEILRRRFIPAIQRFLVGHSVIGVVDLDRGKAFRVVRQHLRGWQFLRIEASLPLGIVITGGADEDGHGVGEKAIGDSG
jgi:hypothetical protein